MNAGIFDYWGYLAFPTAIALPTAAALFFRVFPTRRALAAVAVPAIASLAFFVALVPDFVLVNFTVRSPSVPFLVIAVLEFKYA